jgi:hypothetical protein
MNHPATAKSSSLAPLSFGGVDAQPRRQHNKGQPRGKTRIVGEASDNA